MTKLQTRSCDKCRKTSPATAEFFHRDNSREGGLTTWCKKCRSTATKKWAAQNSEHIREMTRKRYAENPRPILEVNRKFRKARREKLIEHYGGRCACCQEDTFEFLAIDHVNGGGTRHRAEVGKGAAFYAWLIRNNLPEGFRVLCHNCNLAIGFYGACPHKEAVA